jgi:hypothetical protein
MALEPAAAGRAPLPRKPEPDRTLRLGAILAVLLPALFTGGAVALIVKPDVPGIPGGGASPAKLARLAEREAAAPPLHPVVARPGAAALGPESLEPIAGGVRPAPPAHISIPAAGVDDLIQPVHERDGGIEVPDVGKAGWWEAGPRPGEPGRAIVIGHLDTRQGPGLFARVPSLPAGTRISILDRRGEVHRYNVVGGAQVTKRAFPSEDVYGSASAPVLILITCGGPYTPGRGYRDNVLLYARAA